MAEQELFILPINVSDLLSSPVVQAMDDAQFRWYFKLLCAAWTHKKHPCFLPNEDAMLMIYAGCKSKSQWDKKKSLVMGNFGVTDDGKLVSNSRLLREREIVLELREKRALAGRKGAEAKKQNRSNATAVPQQKVAPVLRPTPTPKTEPKALAPTAPPAITLLLNDGSEYPVTFEFAKQMAKLYPAVDVPQQFRNMKGWLIANERKRKTRSGIKNFINTWLSKEQDKGGNHGTNNRAGTTKNATAAVQLSDSENILLNTLRSGEQDGRVHSANGRELDPGEVRSIDGGLREAGAGVRTIEGTSGDGSKPN